MDRRERPIRCIVCRISSANEVPIEVTSYSLTRSITTADGRDTSRSYGTIGLCDRCMRENGVRPERVA